MISLKILKPDDFHVHLREGVALDITVNHIAKHYGTILAMPNTNPPLFTIKTAQNYLKKVKKSLKKPKKDFNPLVALYLREDTPKKIFQKVKNFPEILGFKLYPQNVTTRSTWGVKNLKKIYSLIAEMEKYDIPLMIHGESAEVGVDIFDREKIFIEKELIPLQKRFSKLRITLEHITTKEAVAFVLSSKDLKATITPHHLYLNRNDIFIPGICPHHYCLPIAKRERHRQALIQAATSGSEKFFLGSDSAPHAQSKKENTCGCAGIYSAPHSLFFYTEIFYQKNALKKLENFTSSFGRKHYELKKNTSTIILIRKKQKIPHSYPYLKNERLIPFKAGEFVNWSLKSGNN